MKFKQTREEIYERDEWTFFLNDMLSKTEFKRAMPLVREAYIDYLGMLTPHIMSKKSYDEEVANMPPVEQFEKEISEQIGSFDYDDMDENSVLSWDVDGCDIIAYVLDNLEADEGVTYTHSFTDEDYGYVTVIKKERVK